MPQETAKLYSRSYKSWYPQNDQGQFSCIDNGPENFGANLSAHTSLPTLRIGAICGIINPNQDKIGQLKDRMFDSSYWEKMMAKIENYPQEFNCSDIKRSDRNVEIEDQEGIVVKFPLFKVLLSQGIWAEVRCSNTICIWPNYSKIWVGISYDNGNDESNMTVKDFFDISILVAEKIKLLIFNEYESVLIELKLCNKLSYIYSIFIEIIAEPLFRIQSDLDAFSFGFKKNFRQAIEHNSIKWILNRAYRINFFCIDEENVYSTYCNSFNEKNDEWIISKIIGKEKLKGIFLKQHLYNEGTKFRGVVDNPDGKYRNLCTIVFSRDIIRNISPMIRKHSKSSDICELSEVKINLNPLTIQ